MPNTFQRTCTECGTNIPHDAHPAKVMCSNKCHVRKHRRLKKEGTAPAPVISNQQIRVELAELKLQLREALETFAHTFPHLLNVTHE